MALHEEGVIEHSGQAKELDSGAIDMILDNLQISQYVFPIKSTIRELASNGVDSIREKNTALEILSGRAKVEDYYYVSGKNKEMDEAIKANPGVYKDSRFDPLYYDERYLSTDNKVYITYKQNGNKAKDQLIIRDWGVGLGDYRLQGYLKIGYSTKRLSKTPLGKWGLGAKAPLSMGVPYYQMTSVHNGRKFKFLVYSRHWESIVAPGGYLPLGDNGSSVNFTKNDWINFYNPDGTFIEDKDGIPIKVYYEETDEQNYTEITVDCKKHYITDVRNAVQSQLLYFDNVEFEVISDNGEVEDVEVQAPILYQDEFLILSDNNQFSKPHIVINNVSYGYVNFQEMELEESSGNIGIKVTSGEIDVTPNRENVIWNDMTREVVLKRFKQASRAAKKIITDSFVQTDFMEWLGACVGVFGFGNSLKEAIPGVKALKQLQNIAKVKSSTHPEFKPDPRIKYSGYIPDMFPGLKARLVQNNTIRRRNGSTIDEITRFDTTSVAELFNYPMYVQQGNARAKTDEYLLRQHPGGFILIRDPRLVTKETLEEEESSLKSLEDTRYMSTEDTEFIKQLKAGANSAIRNDPLVVIPMLLKDVPAYEEVEIIETKEDAPARADTPEDVRRRERRIVIQTPRGAGGVWTKVQPKIEALDKIDREFYWGNNEEKEGILAAAIITGKAKPDGKSTRENELYDSANPDRAAIDKHWVSMGASTYEDGSVLDRWSIAQLHHWTDPKAKVLLGIISKENIKYVAEEHYHITEFYNRFEGGVITMSQSLINWNTARLIKVNIEPLKFMEGLKNIDSNRYAIYKELKAFVSEYYHSLHSYNQLETAIIPHLDKVTQLQRAFRESGDNETYIDGLTRELFGDNTANHGVSGANSVSFEWLDKAEELAIWALPIKDMLNMVEGLTRDLSVFNLEQEEAIRQYIEWRTS